jgi:tripeptide aminopeptidase
VIDAEDLLHRFLSYVRHDTQADPHSSTTPSSEKQWVLLQQLETELRGLGLADVTLTPNGYVLANVPSNSPKAGAPTVAFLAHVDTAPGCAANPTPRVHRHYDGGRIVLPDDPRQVLDPETDPHLRGKVGETLITTSGTTLLGADDKAGVAVIMAAVRHLLRHPEIPHGPLRICFNPDEEIGRGTDKLDLAELGAQVAYTLDAESPGELNLESFSADEATVTLRGVAPHPGSARGILVNATRLAAEFLAALPSECSPEQTDGHEGFIYPVEVRGTAEEVQIRMILRDFEREGLAQKGALIESIARQLQERHPRAHIQVEIRKQYRNMRYWLEHDLRPVEFAEEAIRRTGLTPVRVPIRGGTDGSRLTERGLPTPNLFVGFHNVHSEREWVSLQDMVRSAETVVRLAQLWEERS